MTSNIRMIAVNAGDDATLTASSEALPVGNLQQLGRSRVWRTTSSTTSDAIKGDWSGVRVMSGVVLYRCNLTKSATWRIRLWDSAGQSGTLVYDSGAIDALPRQGWGDFIWGVDEWGATQFEDWDLAFAQHWFGSVGAKSIQIDVDDGGNSDNYLQAERLVVGYHIEPGVGFPYGASLEWAENTELSRTAGGTLRSDGEDPYRVMQVELNHLSEPERSRFQEIQRSVGQRKDVFVSGRHDQDGQINRDWAMLAKFREAGPIESSYPLRHATTIKLEET